jgi:hypothetical protein
MIRILRRRPFRPSLVALCAASLLGVTAVPALGYDGDWTLSGSFERTTAPSFADGFNPDDIDRINLAFDNRAKRLSLSLSTFEAPSGGAIDVTLGTGLPDGTCALGAVHISITTGEVLRERIVDERVSEWVPPQERRTWSNTWPGTGWAYAGYDSWSRMHRWIKAGTWITRTVQRTIVEPDPLRVTRTATLERDGVGGTLLDVATVDAGSLTTRWSFAAPELDRTAADCLEVTVPNRRVPFVIAPPQPAPAPDALAPAPPVDPTADPDAIDLELVEVTAVRRGTTIELRLLGGDAEAIGVRARRGSRTLPFRRRVVLRNQPSTVRAVSVRLSDGAEWAPWERISVR